MRLMLKWYSFSFIHILPTTWISSELTFTFSLFWCSLNYCLRTMKLVRFLPSYSWFFSTDSTHFARHHNIGIIFWECVSEFENWGKIWVFLELFLWRLNSITVGANVNHLEHADGFNSCKFSCFKNQVRANVSEIHLKFAVSVCVSGCKIKKEADYSIQYFVKWRELTYLWREFNINFQKKLIKN